MSVILYPDHGKAMAEQFVISRMVSLAVRDLVEPPHRGGTIKWPNDIYVRDDKIAGILIENTHYGRNARKHRGRNWAECQPDCFQERRPQPGLTGH
ncbi:MAG: hypothetical protein MZV63_53440 [Marinilabiliales bacterium]|nr:hypothetical protein [Marinilabiliales bacterium]